MIIKKSLSPECLQDRLNLFWNVSAEKIRSIETSWQPGMGAPVFTVAGRYAARGWTEWTQGFQFGSALLQYDATGDSRFLAMGREATLRRMAPHLTHMGVHDHGFNNVSTYGNLWRMMGEGRIEEDHWQRHFYELALKISGAVQAARWTSLPDGLGFIYSFNGPHSLFADTIRSLRSLALSYQLGHILLGEMDQRIHLLHRLLIHAETTRRFSVYFGTGRDSMDLPGRVAHESIFDIHNGAYRCPNSQQGYSPFTTWTRGLAWILLGFAEQLEFLDSLQEEAFLEISPPDLFRKEILLPRFEGAARVTAEFYMAHSPADGIPFWDTGAPGLANLGDYLHRPADPFNDQEPIDSSAAAIAAQGLLRLGRYLRMKDRPEQAERYWQAGLSIASTLLGEPYLSSDPDHQGLLLHSVYHRPNGWDYLPPGSRIPRGESSMWGDYHLRELALYLHRIIHHQPYLRFFAG